MTMTCQTSMKKAESVTTIGSYRILVFCRSALILDIKMTSTPIRVVLPSFRSYITCKVLCSSSTRAATVVFRSCRRHSSFETDRESQMEKHRRAMMAKGLPKKKPIDGVSNVVLVASGKGGVGKSTIAVNLAAGLKKEFPERHIGLLDADVFGPSLPIMMNLRGLEPDMNSKNQMIPLLNHGVKCMSMGFLVKEGAPIVWRGLMVMQAIEKLIRGVDWNPLDVLIVDMPPGTGDTQLTIAQTVEVDGAVVVTTPQNVAVQDALKGAQMFLKTNVPLLGFVVNMSSYHCPACKVNSPVSREALENLSPLADVIGELPFDLNVSVSCDEGTPIVLQSELHAAEFSKIGKTLMAKLKEKKKTKGITT